MMNFTAIMHRARPWVPLTSLSIIWHIMDKKSITVLDIGCGNGEPMSFINRHNQFKAVGVDVFKSYLDKCLERNIYNELLLCDIRALPLRDKSIDTILCLDVLEHLEKEEALLLITAMEKVAIKQVILATPLHHYQQSAYDNNLYQEHKYIWHAAELKELGYKVITFGIRGISDNERLISLGKKFNIVILLQNMLWVLAGLVTRFTSNLAGHMICIKTFT